MFWAGWAVSNFASRLRFSTHPISQVSSRTRYSLRRRNRLSHETLCLHQTAPRFSSDTVGQPIGQPTLPHPYSHVKAAAPPSVCGDMRFNLALEHFFDESS